MAGAAKPIPLHLLAFYGSGEPHTRSAPLKRFRLGSERVAAYDVGERAKDVEEGRLTAYRIERRSDGKGTYRDHMTPLRAVRVGSSIMLTASERAPIV